MKMLNYDEFYTLQKKVDKRVSHALYTFIGMCVFSITWVLIFVSISVSKNIPERVFKIVLYSSVVPMLTAPVIVLLIFGIIEISLFRSFKSYINHKLIKALEDFNEEK